MIIDLVKQIFIKIHGKPLPRYSVPHRYLKEFTTTKSEKKKNKYRIPDETYAVRDLPSDLPPTPALGDSASDPDSFEENKRRSTTIYQRQAGPRTAVLADFKLIKRLGKGNFGTVLFLSIDSHVGLFGRGHRNRPPLRHETTEKRRDSTKRLCGLHQTRKGNPPN
jgi:hypothetical protein